MSSAEQRRDGRAASEIAALAAEIEGPAPRRCGSATAAWRRVRTLLAPEPPAPATEAGSISAQLAVDNRPALRGRIKLPSSAAKPSQAWPTRAAHPQTPREQWRPLYERRTERRPRTRTRCQRHADAGRTDLARRAHRTLIRFGHETGETVLDRRRRVLRLAPNSVFAFVRWVCNDFGTIISRVDIVRAVDHGTPYQTLPFVRPGGDILLRISGWPKVERVLQASDAVEAISIDPAEAEPDH